MFRRLFTFLLKVIVQYLQSVFSFVEFASLFFSIRECKTSKCVRNSRNTFSDCYATSADVVLFICQGILQRQLYGSTSGDNLKESCNSFSPLIPSFRPNVLTWGSPHTIENLIFFIQGAFRYRTLLSASWKSHIKNGYRCAEGRCDLTSKKSWPLISTPDTLIRFRNSLSWFVITAKQELHFHLTLNI